jgi:hypothetical protein
VEKRDILRRIVILKTPTAENVDKQATLNEFVVGRPSVIKESVLS